RSVSFHYDMGGHGTHVAGLTSGFGVSGESGFNGVAPGAQIISGKFSGDLAKDNTVTGSMKRAYQYAARLADSLQKLHTPVVVNMSFGIGSAY
ncbi:S8 family serine peptidase, partial [Klebsiella pneumoniae]|uniref:S8 family serine peptidase n=1 Tax=Klebsiella pneumoniae TaxID=573 RepID=UPI00200E2DC1